MYEIVIVFVSVWFCSLSFLFSNVNMEAVVSVWLSVCLSPASDCSETIEVIHH